LPKPSPAKNPTPRGDRELLKAIVAGERRALEELYLGYHRRLARFLSRLSPRYELIEEVINDTFLVVWQSAERFRDASQVSTWIMGIAYRTALKSLRRQKNHQTAVSLDSSSEQSCEPASEFETRDWLQQGFKALSDEQRLTLELAYGLGYSLEEIAAVTEAPVGTVKARMFHAREKLRQCLPRLGGEAGSENPAGVA
jgi:RNA polymerase sigma-70 factor (ECF subfamily)